jgi:hypothetical protein
MRATLALLGLLWLANPALADPEIAELAVDLDGDRVLVSLRLRDGITPQLARRLESGLPTPIVYRFELHRDRKRWWDRHLATNTLEAEALYDAVSRSYTVHLRLDGELIESRTVRDRKALEEAMTRIQGIPVFSLDGLGERGRVLVKARAELGSRTLLSMIPVTIATDWKDSRKFRIPRPPT